MDRPNLQRKWFSCQRNVLVCLKELSDRRYVSLQVWRELKRIKNKNIILPVLFLWRQTGVGGRLGGVGYLRGKKKRVNLISNFSCTYLLLLWWTGGKVIHYTDLSTGTVKICLVTGISWWTPENLLNLLSHNYLTCLGLSINKTSRYLHVQTWQQAHLARSVSVECWVRSSLA